MYFVCELPNRVLCLAKKSDELPDGTVTFGDGSEFYEDGKVIPKFRDLPKFKPSLLKLGPLADDA